MPPERGPDRQRWRGFGLPLGRSARVGGSRAVAWVSAARALFRSHDAPRDAWNPDLAVVLERGHLGNGGCPNPLPRWFVDLLKRRDCERNVFADHLPILLGRPRHEFDVDVPLGNVAQPRGLVQAVTYPGAAHRNIFGLSGSDAAGTASVAIACMAIVVHGFSSGLTQTDEQRRPPGLRTRANSAVALATSGKNMYPKRTDTLSNVASSTGRSSALHTVSRMRSFSVLAPAHLRRRRTLTPSAAAGGTGAVTSRWPSVDGE